MNDDNANEEPFFQINERVTHNINTGLYKSLDYVHLVTREVTIVATHNKDSENELMLSNHSFDV